jgi:hypothetical protein
VTGWEPWENPKDGMRLFVDLPAEQGTTPADLAAKAANIAAAFRLPRGCGVRVLDSDRQGVALMDVMLRNTLVDRNDPHVEPKTPASINDSFPIITTPRGEVLSICLRVLSMIIGGTTGSGKTTLLHRIIMWLARCTDAIIFVVDLNGGGVAEPWVSPWATGRTAKPVVDWIADNEEEAAVMLAVANAIAKDRKTNKEAVRRKKAANAMVLPVDYLMPAIVVLTDEGGEVRQAGSLFGQLAAQGITRLAQIGRAEGLRVIMSVLRGTADLTDKGLRVNAALRLCLRMEEHDEYYHVLGVNPGKTELEGAHGAGFLRTPELPRPVLGRTVNVDLAGIDRHAVACGELRPELDEYALRVAAKVTAADVLGGRTPTREHLESPAMRDANRGLAYAGRWDRYAAKLAEMRGEEFIEAEQPRPVKSTALSALDELVMAVEGPAVVVPAPRSPEPMPKHVEGGARIYQFPGAGTSPAAVQVAPTATAREQILAKVEAAGADGIGATELERAVDAAPSRVQSLLKEMREADQVAKNGAGKYVLPGAGAATAG